MDYKAKYEEALEKARVIYKGRKAMHYTDEVSDLESLFPELTEANDEMMIEAIIEALDSHCNSINHLSARGYQMEDVEAWLEKKKDSIPYEKYVEDIAVINAEAKTKYHAGWNDGYEAKQKEQKPKEWNEKPCLTCDEYDKGYKQGYTEGCTAGYNKAMLEQPKQEWSEEDEKHINNILDIIDYWKATMHFVSYQGGTIDADITWLKSRRTQPKCLPGFDEMTPEEKMNHPLYLEGFDAGRDVGKVETEQPKPEWSKEDEEMLNKLINRLNTVQLLARTDSTSLNFSFFQEIGWLKSLRNRAIWKPTEEQMNSLNYGIYVLEEEGYDASASEIKELYEQLKKLMED